MVVTVPDKAEISGAVRTEIVFVCHISMIAQTCIGFCRLEFQICAQERIVPAPDRRDVFRNLVVGISIASKKLSLNIFRDIEDNCRVPEKSRPRSELRLCEMAVIFGPVIQVCMIVRFFQNVVL